MAFFAAIPIPEEQIIVKTRLSFAFVNLKPVTPGHMLVSPLRVVHRFADLTCEETADLMNLARQLGPILQTVFQATSLTFSIQDGVEAGQTVPHCHVHVIPRKKGDFGGDQIYQAIEAERKPRSRQEMTLEAAMLRPLCSQIASHPLS
ncbi:putative diadenosine tetraphosphate hydrolase [Paratrimastix pyriformis]|uniref:Bis(5'-adenosyl)-triphosphatase n=1 Tax=Paratrimastix pyriformis TaxID=342808 RepID=A0ABQ8UR53_9EUKA|nr:putative diadenosine tetraphosphate hydrolase [Paratrimastix pyriformis]